MKQPTGSYPRVRDDGRAVVSQAGSVLPLETSARSAFTPPFDKDLDERILVPYSVESALSGIKRHEDRMW
ncbi:hypothetical protein [Streptomyces cellostaticus]|uniref:hypothetical protein n=1 Tax=Streptomyces TaxID=1883 RepID=UPI0027E3416F|nr:hypothetical protein [Streptomyces cellostaticus]